MMDGGVAVALVVILGFAGFIVWAKSATGRMTLHDSLGEPHSLRKKRRRAAQATRARSQSPAKSTKRSSR